MATHQVSDIMLVQLPSRPRTLRMGQDAGRDDDTNRQPLGPDTRLNDLSYIRQHQHRISQLRGTFWVVLCKLYAALVE